MTELEFFRNSQKSFIRFEVSDDMIKNYEFQMCQYNNIKHFLSFQQRNQNGQQFLYYDISGMQSLDIAIRTRKINRDFFNQIAKAFIKMCTEVSEYALRIECVQLNPEYIMISAQDELFFIYMFDAANSKLIGIERFLEICIENLDYQDKELTEEIYKIYDDFLAQEETFSLLKEMQKIIAAEQEIKIKDIKMEGVLENVSIESKEYTLKEEEASDITKKSYFKLRRSLWILAVIDGFVLFFWKPITLLKIFFCIAGGTVLCGMIIYLHVLDQKYAKNRKNQDMEEAILEEYSELSGSKENNTEATCIFSIENSAGMLYNLNDNHPQSILIETEGKILGKDKKKSQVYIDSNGISRIHAFLIREGKQCYIEDLNSTNGTMINNQMLIPRTRYLLRTGDVVNFAEQQYIFR